MYKFICISYEVMKFCIEEMKCKLQSKNNSIIRSAKNNIDYHP